MPQTQLPSDPVGQSSATEPIIVISGSIPEPQLSIPSTATTLTQFFRMRSRFPLDEHILAGPIAKLPTKAGPDTECIRVASPSARMIVEWQSWRKGARAELPKPYVNDENTILLRNEIDLDNVEIQGGDQQLFISSGTMTYSFLNRSKMTLSYPLPLYITMPPNAVVAQTGDFVPSQFLVGWPNNGAQAVITQTKQ